MIKLDPKNFEQCNNIIYKVNSDDIYDRIKERGIVSNVDFPHDCFSVDIAPNKDEISLCDSFLLQVIDSNSDEIHISISIHGKTIKGAGFKALVSKRGDRYSIDVDRSSDNVKCFAVAGTKDNELGMLIPLGIDKVAGFLELLKDRKIVEGKEIRKKKVGSGKGKKAYQDVTYIYLSKKNKIESFRNRQINWSKSWPVRGHWRYKDGLLTGKDRHGERNQKGRTWVIPSEKQKHLKPGNSIRVIRT